MLRKIKLYGELAKFLGQKTFEAEVHNAAQAIRFLVVNFPQLEAHMADRHYKVAVDDWEIGKDELHYPNGQEDIRIIPVVGGAGRGFGRFLLGAALIGAAFIPGLQGISIGTFGGTPIAVSQIVGTIGASLAFQGIAQMLTPVPDIPEREQDPRLSFNFSGIQNTSRAGVAVPVIYGQVLTGSVVISAGIETAQVEV
jgi:predicted phage tail protein